MKTQQITPYPPWYVFPIHLVCDSIGEISEGPEWFGIKIGVSKIEDLKEKVKLIDDYSIASEDTQRIVFVRDTMIGKGKSTPYSIEACIDNNAQIITVLKISTIDSDIYLSDFVAVYGQPNEVTWGDNNISRTIFWFEEGIALSVNILESNPMLEYGQVGFVIYFPYQLDEGFETRWPYAYTSDKNPPEGDRVYIPTPSQLKNPFDFDAIIATITAQPLSTSTPIFELRPTSITQSPTPTP